MPIRSPLPQTLGYGNGRSLRLELEASRLVHWHRAPEPCADFAAVLRQQLQSPLDFPPLEMAIVPGDRIVVALDRNTPGVAQIIASLWPVFERRGVAPSDITILQPAAWTVEQLSDPRASLPESVRQTMRWLVHDATNKSRSGYLASSANGERIYLARELVDADFVLPIGAVGFDPLLGIRTANRAIFPGMSNVDALAKTRGQDHAELRPEDDRPLRQLQNEVAWLLGVQCGVLVLPSAGDRPAGVLFGATESVAAAGQAWLQKSWMIETNRRCEVVVLAVEAGAAGDGWHKLGAALLAARNLVERGGKIVVLTDLAAEPSDGFEYLKQSESPKDALKPLRLEAPPDLIPVSRLASAADWATVYLVSPLNSAVVENLFMTPLGSAAEAAKLVHRCESCVVVESAQHSFGFVT